MSIFDGLSRPMRAAGLGLIAVAVIAGVIGGITLLGSGDDSEQTAQPSTSQEQQPPGDGERSTSAQPTSTQPTTTSTSTTSQPPAAGSPSTQPSQPGTPSTPGAQPGGTDSGATGQDQQAGAKWVGLRVYNNSTIKGLANTAADDFRAQGWNVVQVDNYPSGIIPTSTAYFRPGTDEEAAARSLAGQFGLRVEPRFDGIQDSSPGVIVIVTQDYESTATS
ncbi:LytR C-terminal domain-containing protein [Saccharomonospora sp. NPDC046836]|uniref:LytR C-terminal domain-containing protein n=1 Tax=Saccharomonospora sp. NPDC046836 TaxID=3156921 RepID=UPI0033FE7025